MEELLDFTPQEWRMLEDGGLATYDLPGEEVAQVFAIKREYSGLSANDLCGWLLHSKTFLIRFVHLSEAVMCPACLRGFDRWP